VEGVENGSIVTHQQPECLNAPAAIKPGQVR